MSKIEEALKKIAHDRNSSDVSIRPVGSSRRMNQADDHSRRMNEKMNALLDVEPIEIDNLMLSAAADKNMAVLEEYNKLRSSVIALTRGEKFLNTLMVTSTVSEEGKSMTALNLAISLAKEHDHTVLLVDADLRRPSIHKYLGLDPDVGLVQCLKDNLPIEEVLIKTGIGKLVVLPAGGSVDDPIDLLSSNRMKEIIRELKGRYSERYVIFDTPPALPFADAAVLAASTDSILYVVREGKADKEDLHKTIDDFREHNLLGVVYNDAYTFFNKQQYYYYS